MKELLTAGLSALNLPTEGIPSLERYAELLVEKNKVMNLTAITEPRDVATLHFLDCAALLTLAEFKGKKVADVGTGAGFPGMPLRILEPSMDITLLDSLNKRIDFLKEVCEDLGLSDVDCVHARAEEFAAEHRESYDIVTSRAVANLQMLCELCLPLVKVGGCMVALKGPDCAAEIEAAQNAIKILGGKLKLVKEYDLADAGSRTLVVIEKVAHTPPKYPRQRVKLNEKPL